jgi:hypothetical protein
LAKRPGSKWRFGRQNARFFAGTRVAAAAEAVLREAAPPATAAAE